MFIFRFLFFFGLPLKSVLTLNPWDKRCFRKLSFPYRFFTLLSYLLSLLVVFVSECTSWLMSFFLNFFLADAGFFSFLLLTWHDAFLQHSFCNRVFSSCFLDLKLKLFNHFFPLVLHFLFSILFLRPLLWYTYFAIILLADWLYFFWLLHLVDSHSTFFLLPP